jgi:hypothetical protein
MDKPAQGVRMRAQGSREASALSAATSCVMTPQ